MGRRDNRCSMQHTPQSPSKNRIRRKWLSYVEMTHGRFSDIVTISHGALEAMMMVGWGGNIQVVDTDPGVIQAAKYMIAPTSHGQVDYPDLRIDTPICADIRNLMPWYLFKHGSKNLGAVDIDLTGCVGQAWEVALPVVQALLAFKVRASILLTFRNGRRCKFDSLDERIGWVFSQFPKGLMYVSHTPYMSGRIREDASRHKGSAMCTLHMETSLYR